MTTHNPYAIEAYEEACTALHFARQHDWGQLAELDCVFGVYFIRCLKDAYTLNGEYFEELTMRPATMKAVREFGGY